MKIQVFYFAGHRELLGKEKEALDLNEGASTADLLKRLPNLGKGVAVAVNRTVVTGDRKLQEGDEVAFLPPMSGG
ncbi:MAG: MoaD/ThiS family protein [Pseudomonadota bacterium]